jgi:hypothetical protein
MRRPRRDRYTRPLAALARPQLERGGAPRCAQLLMTERVTGAPAIHFAA